MSELISIVLPVYNGARFLRESIDSICNQTYTNWELLILDDCSTDDTPVISREYADRDSRIHYYRNEKNLKLPGNLNRGFSLATGEYLTWTSDDNRFHPMALERMINTLMRHPDVGLVYASYQAIDENGNIKLILQADPNAKEHIWGSNIVGACFMYTRRVYEQVGDYDEDLLLVEDFDYWQRVVKQFDTMAISEVLYDYRWHESSLTSTKNEKRFGEVLEKMLIKNRSGIGRLNMEMAYFYYSALDRSYKGQGKRNRHGMELKLLYICWRGKHLIERIRRKLWGK